MKYPKYLALRLSVIPLASLLALAIPNTATADTQAKKLLKKNCMVCHSADADDNLSRISELRKSPEGWQLSLYRMQRVHKASFDKGELATILKYLADNQGLAPKESEPYRYALERSHNRIERIDKKYQTSCARCHSAARFSLQRRTEEEWKNLIHTHMGLYPSLEYHAGSRDHPWLDTTLNKTAVSLAKDYPLVAQAWTDWKAAEKANLAGQWIMSGYMDDKGDFHANMQVTQTKPDHYQIEVTGQYADGSPLTGKGKALVYTGYEWRGNLTLNNQTMRQVFAANADGTQMSGRTFSKRHNELGGITKLVRADVATPTLLSVTPNYIQQGQTQTLLLTGANLSGEVTLSEGLTLNKPASLHNGQLQLEVSATKEAKVGLHAITIAGTSLENAITVYDQVASVRIEPKDSVARIGGNNSPIPKQHAAYRAVAYSAGADGKTGTEDDLRIGYMPATWSLKEKTEEAKADKDLKYAGTINANGVFTPGDAGLNPERKKSTNNVGYLSVVGTVKAGEKDISGEASLLVTVQDFVRNYIE